MFWDSSALVPIVIGEERTRDVLPVLSSDPAVTLWWGSAVECQSAIQRRNRESPLPRPVLAQVTERLQALLDDADQIDASDDVRQRAVRLLATHPLRAADALQLAAALIWCEEKPRGEGFVCLDDRLREAADREGFDIYPARGAAGAS